MKQTLALLLPALLPSWRFFDWVAPSPRIEYQCTGETTWHDYSPRTETAPHVFKRLFWNGAWNDYLFTMSCAERYAQNQTTGHSHQEIIKRLKHHAPTVYQFRLVFVARDTREIIYVSDKLS